MTRRYKQSYKSSRGLRRFGITFDAPQIAAQVTEKCTICEREIEVAPMMRGVCYGCYRNLITAVPVKYTEPTLEQEIAGHYGEAVDWLDEQATRESVRPL